ncbi:MAG: GNAT family N-acetyltransferase [Hyphomicrobiales bacterium]
MPVETMSVPETIFTALTPGDLDAIFSLHLEALAAVGRPELVKPESKEFFERMLAGAGRVIGASRDGALIAYGVLQFDLPSSEDARPLLALDSGDDLAKLAGASVHPSVWGKGLHDALIGRRIEEAGRLAIRHLYSTSAPGNARSWANLLDRGFCVRGIIEKYGGHLRYVLYRDLALTPGRSGEGLWCDVGDIARQRLLIANGFAGARWRTREDGGFDICYREAR